MKTIQETIRQHLINLQIDNQVGILFACESGSRAWGFPSPDSDYDVRFVYVHPVDWYLSIEELRDVIEMPINAELDISGWDLRKSMRLVMKRNCVLFEWIQSPIFYVRDEAAFAEFVNGISASFAPLSALHHYLSSAKKHFDGCLTDKVTLKKYLYCLRCTLAAAWISLRQTIPPMEISKLLTLVDDQVFINRVMDLIALKAGKDESYLHVQEPWLQDYLQATIAQAERAAATITPSKGDTKALDNCFRSLVRRHDH